MPTYQGLSVCSIVLEHAPPNMIDADLAHQVLQSLRTSLASPALAPDMFTALDKIISDFYDFGSASAQPTRAAAASTGAYDLGSAQPALTAAASPAGVDGQPPSLGGHDCPS